MCHTLAGIVETELRLNNREHASHALARARKGPRRHGANLRGARVLGTAIHCRDRRKLAKLRQVLNRLQQQVDPSFF